MNSMATLKCILHTFDADPTEEVQPFTLNDTKWTRVRTAASIHLEKRKTSKYLSLCQNLPDVPGQDSGYHYSCYRKFTTVPSAEKPETSESTSAKPGPFRRSQSLSSLKTTSSGVLPDICIFCNKKTLKVKQHKVPLVQCEMDTAESSIKTAAKTLNDHIMLAKIGSIGFHSKEVKYHEKCRHDYLNSARGSRTSDTSENRQQLDDALDTLFGYIEASVIDNNRPEYLQSLYERYVNSLKGPGLASESETVGIRDVRTLASKIKGHFGQRVHIDASSRKKGLVVFSSRTSKEAAFAMAHSCSSMDEFTVFEAARILRSAIMATVDCAPELPTSLSLEDFKKGQVETPSILKSFYMALLSGSSGQIDASADVERRVLSLSNDVIYCVSRGLIKPAKHLCMGLGLKSMTGSRKVVEIMNKFGHSVSYHVAESMETEIANSIVEKEKLLPNILRPQQGLATGVAWDNFDELTETLSGKDTLHDTVGICHQNVTSGDQVPDPPTLQQGTMEVEVGPNAEVVKPSKRRRQFESRQRSILPYKRRPSISKFEYDTYTADQPSNLKKAEMMNIIWMICCYLHPDTPMWRGWNSLVCADPLPQQVIGYMENIELSPTRLDVVKETMTRSQKVASECGEKFAIVTYDLAIAKPALQIQAQESPQFDNVFVCFGAFHIFLAYFACLGYLLESSGGPDILCGANVLASGSMKGFIKGKHFNRCKRIHPLLATALQILHFKRFLESQGRISDECMASLNAFCQATTPASLSKLLESASIAQLLEKYVKYTEDTRAGLHGPTAEFWIMYVDLVHLYLLMDRACRTNDVALFIYALGKMCPIFFAANRPNYARWMTMYQLNLLNMETTHPGIRQVFDAGALSIRRTAKSFSRCPVDLTLEQTVNRDAASRQGGISAFTQNVEARKRWTITRSFRGGIVSCLLEMAGLTTRDEVSAELKPARIRKDNDSLKELMNEIEGTLNPFTVEDDNLYCLSTGKAASKAVKDDLLQFVKKGKQWHEEFVTECKDDSGRFERPIKRQRVKNFTNDAVKMKVSSKDQKLMEAKCTRDLFGRLLYLAVEQGIDLATVMSYPLTPIPLSLCHITGNMHKSAKSVLMEKLEAMGPHNTEPARVDAYLIDAMFFIRALHTLPLTFGGVAKVILQQACTNANVVHLVCDTYKDQASIKDQEHDFRGESMHAYKITGPLQKRPNDFRNALLSPEFKNELLSFLKDEWTAPIYAPILEDHSFYFAVGGECFHYTAVAGRVQRTQVIELQSEHEEADTRLIFHVAFISEVHDSGEPVVVIRSNDTDVLILLLYHSQYINAKLWLDAGVNAKNTRRLVDISELAEKITPARLETLPGYHAFTGSDFTASFIRKGKWKPFEIMVKCEAFTKAMSALGTSDRIDMDVSATLEDYVCSMYGMKNVTQVNEARLNLFRKLYGPKKKDDPYGKIKTSDPCCLPPCKSVLDEKLKRVNHVAYLWKNARKSKPVDFGPVDHGWKLSEKDNSRLDMVWFQGLQMPPTLVVEESVVEEETEETDDEVTESLSSDEDDSGDEFEWA